MFQDLQQALITLSGGGTILYPTDTIWGLGCDATNPKAVDKIYQIKQRESSKSLIILVNSLQMLQNYVEIEPELLTIAQNLMQETSNALTIVYSKNKNLAANLSSDGTIAIRLTKDEFCSQLIEQLGKPIVSTSANISGEPSAANFAEVNDLIKQRVDYVVKYRQNDDTQTKASTIIQLLENGQVEMIRK